MQHYKDNNFFQNIKDQQERDQRKDKLLTEHYFQVIRIPYNKLDVLTDKSLIYMITHPKYGKVRNLKNLVSCE